MPIFRDIEDKSESSDRSNINAGLQKVVQGPRLCCRVWLALVCCLLGSGNLLWGTEGRIGPLIQ